MQANPLSTKRTRQPKAAGSTSPALPQHQARAGLLGSAAPAPTPPRLDPEFARVEEAARLYGVNRTRLYEEAGAGNIRMVKLGRATLVDLNSLRAFIASLPQATIRVQRRRGKASA